MLPNTGGSIRLDQLLSATIGAPIHDSGIRIMLVSLVVVSSLMGFHTLQSTPDLWKYSSVCVAFSLNQFNLMMLCYFVVLGLVSLNHELVSIFSLCMYDFFACTIANMVLDFRLN